MTRIHAIVWTIIFGALGMWLGSYDNWFLNIISFLLYGMAGLSAIQLFRAF